MRFGAVDATRFKSLTLRFGVNGYPTLFFVVNGTEVRRAAVAHTTDALVHYATTGWKAQPVSVTNKVVSPYGTWGWVKFHALYWVERVLAQLEPIAERTGMPLILVQFAAMIMVVMGTTAGLIAFAVWLGPPKPRRYTAADAARQRPHED